MAEVEVEESPIYVGFGVDVVVVFSDHDRRLGKMVVVLEFV